MNDLSIKNELVKRGFQEDVSAKFEKYYEMLIEWNERLNLTAITAPAEVLEKHFLDSMEAAPYIPQGARCVDIGSGAGFPGIPLKLIRPDIELLMIDSLGKRITFLREVISALGLDDCRAEHLRAEEAGAKTEFRETFDIALTRAVAPTGAIIEWSAPLIKVGGTAILYKGAQDTVETELSDARGAIAALHTEIDTKSIETPWGARTLVLCKKLKKTDRRFPRKPGEARRKPL